ncbi:hypothetical protein ECDEC2A_2464 [Escherichia coli DEC2A]|nr:hypothetical protein ECDEC2A_2464 [Escherichia coli DEC2A]
MTTQTEAPHFPGAGVNITDRGDLSLKPVSYTQIPTRGFVMSVSLL